MTHLLASLAVGVLGGAGIWLLFERSSTRLLYGLLLLSHAANLFLLLANRWSPLQHPPFIAAGAERLADAVPHAFILTAIVIGFGVTGFVVMLLIRLAHSEDRTP